jgi:hypothetical protein
VIQILWHVAASALVLWGCPPGLSVLCVQIREIPKELKLETTWVEAG